VWQWGRKLGVERLMEEIRYYWYFSAEVGKYFLLINLLLCTFLILRKHSDLRAFGVFLMIDYVVEYWSSKLGYAGINNLPLLHAYTLLQFLALTFFYARLFGKGSWLKQNLIQWITSVGLLLVLNSIFLQSIYMFNTNATTLVQVILIAYTTGYFFNIYGRTDLTKRVTLALVLINSAVLIYNAGTLFVFMFSEFVNQTWKGAYKEAQSGLWMFNSILFMTFQLVIFVALCGILSARRRY
jgi:hypothetical protein